MNDNDSNWVAQHMMQAISIIQDEKTRPSVLFRPKVFVDGDEWCALYGDNIQEGVAAFGTTPDEATRRFDAEWFTKKAALIKRSGKGD